MKSTLKSRFLNPGRNLIPSIVLFAGLVFTTAVCYKLETIGEAEDQERFRTSAQEVVMAVEGRMETYQALLRASAGFFAGSEGVTHNEFKDFVAQLSLREHYPGIMGIGYSVRLKPEERNTLIENKRREGLTNFKIFPEGERTEYHSIIHLEPQDERNQLALGYDMYSDSVRRAAMEQARDTGQAAASGAVRLVQDADIPSAQVGFLVYLPVYQRGSDTSTVEARRMALLGFVYSPLRADDFLSSITTGHDNDVDVKVYDGPDPNTARLVHDSSRIEGAVSPNHQPRFIATTTAHIPAHTWTINFSTRPSFDLGSSKTFVPYALAGGLLISLLFFAVTLAQVGARDAAEMAAADLRISEAAARKSLIDRERAEEALIESEERYRELFENANDVVCTLGLDYKVTEVNKAGERLTGYTRDELLSMDLSTLMTPASAEISRSMLAKKLTGEARTNYEVDLQTKSGQIVTVEISSRLVMKNGKPMGVQAIARDITVRRRAEEALREADQRALSEYERLLERIASLSQALGTARDLLSIFRALREFTAVSAPGDGLFVSLYDPLRDVRTACYCWGDGQEFDVSDLPPMPVSTFGPNSRAVRTGEVVIIDDYMEATRGRPSVTVGPDNGLRPQSSLVVPMAVMGRIVGTIEIQSYQKAAYRDEHVTAMRMAANLCAVAIENVRLLERESSARATAEESNRLKDEFLATVSHELRTPLTAILGWSRMLEDGSLDEAGASRAIETIRRNAVAQSQIVDDILDVSRIITGNLYLDLQPIELAPVIEAAINVVRPTADAKGIRVDVEFEAKPLVVSGDSNRLQQVIWNLLSNAIKFTPTGGHVRTSVRQVDSCVEITVSDTGPGISPDFLPFVFDRFRQADSTTTRKHGGLGLGLAIARHLVEIHGGTIHAGSAGEEGGSSFCVRLPLLAALAKSQRELQEPSLKRRAELHGLHILLVDDDEDTLELLKTALMQCQARVTAVTSADEALEVLKLSDPDILISDIAMPVADGYELIKQARALGSARFIPAVAITAYAKEEDRVQVLASGYQHYVTKPIDLAELLAAVVAAANGAASEGIN